MVDKRIFIERRKNKQYSIERPDSSKSSGLFDRQIDAINRAKQMDSSQINVERVRNTKIGHPDKWRKP